MEIIPTAQLKKLKPLPKSYRTKWGSQIMNLRGLAPEPTLDALHSFTLLKGLEDTKSWYVEQNMLYSTIISHTL